MGADKAEKQLVRLQQIEELSAKALIMEHDASKGMVTFMVPSNDQKNLRPPYRVSWRPKRRDFPEDNAWFCQCDHYKFNNEKEADFKCKHIEAVRSLLERILRS